MATGLSLNWLKTDMIDKVVLAQDAVKTKVGTMTTNGDLKEMLEIQLEMQGYTATMDLTSTMVKQVGDGIKGIIQKAG
jgi:type III secretion apparatus needle protein